MAGHFFLMALVFGTPSPQGEVRGIVQDEWGKPVPHAQVYLPSSEYDSEVAPTEWLSTTADARGRFVFQGVPHQRVAYGAFAIHPEAGWTVNVATREPEQTQRTTLTITLARPTELLTGRVVNPEGDPIPGATVKISQVNSRFIPVDLPSTTTNNNGRFHLNIPPHSYITLTASEDSHATQSFDIEPGTSPFIILPRAAYLTATFVDENSGEPAGSIPVKVVSADQEMYRPILVDTSDASGKIRLKVPSEAELLLYSEDLKKGAYVPIKTDPLNPQETRDLGTVLVRRRPNLTVTLKPPQGTEVPKGYVSLRSSHRVGDGTKTLYISVEVGKELKTEIPLADGKYVIYAWSYVQD
ncbi:MAG: carboxypeptidase-like regulatory domain-containing protein, partial [Fimbriimonadales bacterium]|nr:carboxypeptidase-like regulatory domain-containing protein [Fimbriimonadales bacterium]